LPRGKLFAASIPQGSRSYEVKFLPNAQSSKTSTRLGQPGEAYALLARRLVAVTL